MFRMKQSLQPGTGLDYSTKNMTFEIVQTDTKTMASPGKNKNIILLAANLQATAAQEEMILGLFERFKLQRMMSPPDTSMLLITVIGPCDAGSFVARWRQLVAADPIATVFMSRMEKADFATAPTPKDSTPQFCSLLAN